MRSNWHLLVCAVLTAIIFQNCQRDTQTPADFNNNNNQNNNNPTVTAGIRGTIVDENSQPIEGATVISGSNSTTSDRYGNFSFNNLTMTRDNGNVTVSRSGYFQTTRSF